MKTKKIAMNSSENENQQEPYKIAVHVTNNGKARLLVASKRTNDLRVGLIIVDSLIDG